MPKRTHQPFNPPSLLRLGRSLILAATLTMLAWTSACRVNQLAPTPTLEASPDVASTQSTRTPRPRRTSTPTASPSLTPTRSITLAPAALQGQVVRFWHPYTGKAQVLLDLITQEFNNTNRWGIKVENTSLLDFMALEERLRQAIQQPGKEQLPDVWPMTSSQILLLDANGQIILDLQPYVSDPIYGLTISEQEDFLPALWEQDQIPSLAVKGPPSPDGKRLGLPWVRSAVLFLYNRSWAQELGYTNPPRSTTGFREQACAAAQANLHDGDRQNDGSGGWLVTGDPAELAGWIYAFGGDFIRPDGRGYQFDTPEGRLAVDFIQMLSQQGCAWEGDIVPSEAVATRQALFAAVSLSELEGIQTNLTGTDVDWRMLPFPPEETGKNPVVVSFGPSLTVAQSTPRRQLAAWLFVRWLVSPENQARWAQFNHSFPTRLSTLNYLQASPFQDSAWQAWHTSLELLPSLHAEPYYASWGRVRWSLADALSQLMLPDQPSGKSPQVLQMLDELAAEIHIQIR